MLINTSCLTLCFPFSLKYLPEAARTRLPSKQGTSVVRPTDPFIDGCPWRREGALPETVPAPRRLEPGRFCAGRGDLEFGADYPARNCGDGRRAIPDPGVIELCFGRHG